MKIRVRKCIRFRRTWPPQPRQVRQNLAQGASHGLGLCRASEPREGERGCDGTPSYTPPGLWAYCGVCFPGLAPWAKLLRPSGPGAIRWSCADLHGEVLA
jgi:hypothetical protein